MKYTVLLKKSASKQLKLLPKNVLGRVVSTIDNLTDNPRPENCKKLQGAEDTYRIRVGDYRVLYTVDDAIVTVEVVKIGNRKDVYKH